MVESALDLEHYERGLRAQGFRLIAGVDEAGRGALAGPLVAAAVILPDGFDLEGTTHLKMLTANQRAVAFDHRRDAVAWSVHRCMPTRIDRRGLQRTNLSLLRRCVTGLSVQPDYVLSDGFPVRRLPVPNLSIKKGDAVTASVAAASIVAKVTRDRMMDRSPASSSTGSTTPRLRDERASRRAPATRPHSDPPVLVQGPRTGFYDGDRVTEP